MSKIVQVAFAFCLFSALSLPAAAQVYKWVDDKGVTHYGERPPQSGKAQELPRQPSGPAPTPATPTQPSWQEQDRAFRQRRVEADQAEAKARQQQESNRKSCNQARDHLAQMKAAGYLYRLDANGQRVVESDAERQASISRLEGEIARNCR